MLPSLSKSVDYKAKYNQQKQMKKFDANSLALIKYNPQEILFMHKETRTLYRYFNPSTQTTINNEIQHPALLRSIAFNQGVLYQKQQSTLLNQIALRKRSHLNRHFLQEQITNTFVPLFDCLVFLHNHKIVHGAVHLENIVVIQEEIKLRDWNGHLRVKKQYYNEKIQILDDFAALGHCLMNCIDLETHRMERKKLQSLLQMWYEKFSKCFFVVLYILVKEMKEEYLMIPKILQGSQKALSNKLNECYYNFAIQKQKKKSPRNNQNCQQSCMQTPNSKKISFGVGKRAVHYQNIQNKTQIFEGKKISQKSYKPIQKGIHELMTKKLNEEQKKIKQQQMKKTSKASPILNLSNSGIQNKSKKFQKERTSSFGFIRSNSKKK